MRENTRISDKETGIFILTHWFRFSEVFTLFLGVSTLHLMLFWTVIRPSEVSGVGNNKDLQQEEGVWKTLFH